MDLYRGTISEKQPDGIFNHFGTLLAACQRVESLFTGQAIRQFNGEKFAVFTYEKKPIKLTSPEEIYNDFLTYIEKARIHLYRPSFGKGFRLRDCWEDDPIGSGALSIIEDETDISPSDLRELRELFHPFGKEALHMDVIDGTLSPQTIRSWERLGRSNTIFMSELNKRKARALVRGEDWDRIKPYEIVWLHYTLKLRSWALSKGYDFFEYHNDGEDEGSLSYITLKQNSVGHAVQTLSFDTQKLRDVAAPLFAGKSITEWHKNKALRAQLGSAPPRKDTYWCGYNPLEFICKT